MLMKTIWLIQEHTEIWILGYVLYIVSAINVALSLLFFGSLGQNT